MGSVRQDEAAEFRVAPVKDADVADALDQFAAGTLREQVERGVAVIAFADPGADFDQLVIGQRAVHFGDDRVGQAVVAEGHDGMEGVAEATQVFLLAFRELHPVSIVEPEPRGGGRT